MVTSITLKVAMTITSHGWRWVHESAWDAEHAAFAAECACFAGSDLQRTTWLSTGRRDQPQPLRGGYQPAGRWILQRHERTNQISNETPQFLAAASLQWEDGYFCSAWMFFSDAASALTGDQNPAYWLIEAIALRLAPDHIVVEGGNWIDVFKDCGEIKYLNVPVLTQEAFIKIKIARIDSIGWESFAGNLPARKELDWIRRQAARENREQEFAVKPRKTPFLMRLLLSISPFRRRRSGKMVHPIDRLKQRLS